MMVLFIYGRFGERSSSYFSYCREAEKNISELTKVYNKKRKTWTNFEKDFPKVSSKDITPEDHDYIINYISQSLRHEETAIVFGVMCLEAFIYDYAAHYFTDSYVKKYLDKLDLKAKWVIIPKLVTGKDFPTDGQAFQELQQLIEERNKLVHHKSRPEKNEREFEEWIKELEKKSSRKNHISTPYETIVKVLTELDRLDCDNKNNSWWHLEEEE